MELVALASSAPADSLRIERFHYFTSHRPIPEIALSGQKIDLAKMALVPLMPIELFDVQSYLFEMVEDQR